MIVTTGGALFYIVNRELKKGRAVTVGTFDGVHRGHRMVLDMLKAEASKRGLQPMAMTFDRHPLDLICPERSPGNLLTTRRKEELIRKEGVEPIVMTFNEQLRYMRAYEWLSFIYRKYDVGMLVIGYDNTFGSDGIDLTLGDMKAMGESIGIEILEAPEVAGVSSSRIRKAVRSGDISAAIEMLGHRPEVEGTVIAGFHVGSDIGFPTANLQLVRGAVLPPRGVYVADAYIDESEEMHRAMVNIGMRPTFQGTDKSSDHPTVEAHIIGIDNTPLYGHRLRLEFMHRIRDERRFHSVEALKAQLEADREVAISMG